MDFLAILSKSYWLHRLTVLKFITQNGFLSALFKILDPEHIKVLADDIVDGIRIREVTVVYGDSFLIWALICLHENFLDFCRNVKLLMCAYSFSTKRIAFRAKISFGRLFDFTLNCSGKNGLDVSGIGRIDLRFVKFYLLGFVLVKSGGLFILGRGLE